MTAAAAEISRKKTSRPLSRPTFSGILLVGTPPVRIEKEALGKMANINNVTHLIALPYNTIKLVI